MKLWILSDLHLDHGGEPLLPPPDADIAVIAGDVVDDTYLAMLAKMLPTVFVAGNHEHYGYVINDRHNALMAIDGLHVLENQQVVVDGIRFVGTTLWTDYDNGNQAAMDYAGQHLTDHQAILSSRQPQCRFRPPDALMMHRAARFMLEEFFADRGVSRGAEPPVVITHHAPSQRSIHPRFAGQLLNRAFYSDLDDLVEASGAALWVHGHVHNNFRYRIGDTEVICNPRGYPGENPDFDPNLLVEIDVG